MYSEAIPEDAPERIRAKELNVPQLTYFQALGEISKEKTVIAVCGTHGKSSTTAMVASVLIDAGLDPTIVVGTKVPQLDGRNWRKGSSDYFLLEACEYRGSFLHLHPDIVLMTNVDGDHFDAFASLEQYQDVYRQFLNRLPEDGVLITHMKDPDCKNVGSSKGRSIIDADQLPLPELSVPGLHMQQNAQLVTALANHLGIESAKSLKSFTGTWRRFEQKGDCVLPDSSTVPVIDDYAHHPREITATIQAAQQLFPGRRIVCLYQPHMHNRTRTLYEEFCSCFNGADLVAVTDVYDARSSVDADHIDILQLTEDIQCESVYVKGLEEAKKQLCCSLLQQGDVLLVLGAGDVTTVAEQLTSA